MLFSGVFDLPWWGLVLVILALTHVTIASVTIFLHRCQVRHLLLDTRKHVLQLMTRRVVAHRNTPCQIPSPFTEARCPADYSDVRTITPEDFETP